jgi:hypothetical protein
LKNFEHFTKINKEQSHFTNNMNFGGEREETNSEGEICKRVEERQRGERRETRIEAETRMATLQHHAQSNFTHPSTINHQQSTHQKHTSHMIGTWIAFLDT